MLIWSGGDEEISGDVFDNLELVASKNELRAERAWIRVLDDNNLQHFRRTPKT